MKLKMFCILALVMSCLAIVSLSAQNITIRARGTMGGENLELRINGTTVNSWTMTTSYQDLTATGDGTIDVYFTNDDQLADGMDIQVDYIIYNGQTYQAEDQEENTGVYVNNSCGGSYSEMLQCNGYIRFETGANPTNPPGEQGSLGDVNDDGVIDIVDALLIAQYYVNIITGEFNTANADVNCSGEIDIVDALLVAQLYVGLLDELPCATPEITPGPTPDPTQSPNCGNNPTPVRVNVNFTGSPFTGSHQVVVETDPSLPQFTIFRPSDLGPGKNYPILAWGQGGCSTNGLSNPEFNAEIASHGYLMIADGTPNGSGGGCGSAYSMDLRSGECLLDAIHWAIEENNNPCSQYYQCLDISKTAAFGWSCGGIMAEGAGSMHDPVLTTFMLNSSGMMSANQSVIDAFETPGLFLVGGPGDMAYENSKRDYNAIKTGAIPAIFLSTDVGHGGTYSQDNGGSFAQVDLAWLNWWLKDDMGATGKGYFIGSTCKVCSSAWEMATKNLP
ncbi:MAG: hypothetical protein JXJ04_10000 [Spirochaetales bacterium]|nr:hypothetical protein [Spirochaetales bacterium]